MITNNFAYNNAPTFKINKLSTDSKNYISTNDTNKDGGVDFNEFQAAGGLTGDVKSKLSVENLKAVYASFAGSDAKLDAREYGQALVYIDSRSATGSADFGDGTITQAESDKFFQELQEVNKGDAQFGALLNYRNITSLGSTLGLDVILPLGIAQRKELTEANNAINASDTKIRYLKVLVNFLQNLSPVLTNLQKGSALFGQDKIAMSLDKIAMMLIMLITPLSQKKG
jgi:hypothetical protein